MVDFTDVSTKALQEMKKSRQGLFDKIGLYGAESRLAAVAEVHARDAVANAMQKNATATVEELTKVADTAFRGTFGREATSLLASEGHIGASIVHSARNAFGGVFDGGRQVLGFTRNTANQVVVKEPGRISKSLSWLPNKIGNFARNNPKWAFAAVGLGAVYGGAKLLEGRNEAKQQAAYDANMQQVAAMQQQAAMANPYYGGVTREEAAAMEAQMRNGGQQGGFAEAEAQRRAAAAAVQQAPSA